MNEKIIIRDALIKDLPEIVAIYNSTVESGIVTADTEPVTIESREKWFYDHHPTHRPVWIVEQNKEPIAWVSFQSFYGRPAYRITAEISIYIKPSFRGRGVGNYLLSYSIERCPQLGIQNLLGFIFSHNEPSLQLFYKHHFVDWGVLPDVAVIRDKPMTLKILGRKIM